MTTVAIFSDVHANPLALEAVLADIDRRNVDLTFCLGDLVGYGPEPDRVIEIIRKADIPAILGNYDDGVGFERGGCGCFYPDEKAKRIGAASYDFTSRVLTPDAKTFLKSLPRERRLEVGGRSLHLVHGSPRRINEYLLPTRDRRTFERIAAGEDADADILVFGHTHKAWHRSYGGILFINVPSVGKPTDGDPRAAYTLLHLASPAEPEVEDVPVAYDCERVAELIVASGLPRELADHIRSGR